MIAAVAHAFSMDPATVFEGTDYQVAVRIAAERALGRMMSETAAAGG